METVKVWVGYKGVIDGVYIDYSDITYIEFSGRLLKVYNDDYLVVTVYQDEDENVIVHRHEWNLTDGVEEHQATVYEYGSLDEAAEDWPVLVY